MATMEVQYLKFKHFVAANRLSMRVPLNYSGAQVSLGMCRMKVFHLHVGW